MYNFYMHRISVIVLAALVAPLFVSAQISPELQKYIDDLNATSGTVPQPAPAPIQQQKTAKPVTMPQTTTVFSSGCPSLSRTLFRGARGTDVTQLQNFLVKQGDLAVGNNTGYFGALTEAAVKLFQKRNGIVSSGTPSRTGYGAVGPKTRAAIARICSSTTTSGGTSYAQGSYGNSYSQASYAVPNYSQGAYYSQGTYATNVPTYSQASYYSQGSYSAQQSAVSPYVANSIKVNGSPIPAYSTPSGLVGYQLSGSAISAYTSDGSLLWKHNSSGTSFSGGGDVNADGYPDLVTTGYSDLSANGTSWGEIRDGRTGTLLSSLTPLVHYCPNSGGVNYCSARWFVGSVLFGTGNILAEVPQYNETGWFMAGNLMNVSQIAAYYTSLGTGFDSYAAAKAVPGTSYSTPHIPESMVQNGLLVKASDGFWRLVAFTSARVLQYRVADLSSAQLISDTPLLTGNRADTGGRNYGLVVADGTKVILISGTNAQTLLADARSGMKSSDPWGGLARHVAIFDTVTATIVDRFYSWAHDTGNASQYINRVTYPAHPVVGSQIFFNVFDGTNWYVSVNDLSLTEVARIPETYVWDTVEKKSGGSAIVYSKTAGYWPEKTTFVGDYVSGALSVSDTFAGLPVMPIALRTGSTSSSDGYLYPVLVGDSGIITQ